jgi:hypothetical protein
VRLHPARRFVDGGRRQYGPGEWGRRRAVVPLCLMMMVGLDSPEARAEASHPFVDEYVYAGGDRQQAAVRAAIEHIVSSMNVVLRPFARRRLIAVSEIPPVVRFQTKGERIAVVLPPRPPRYSTLDGAPIEFRMVGGGDAVLTRRIGPNNELIEVIDSGGRQRVITYRITKSGRFLEVIWQFVAPRLLPEPLRFELIYRKNTELAGPDESSSPGAMTSRAAHGALSSPIFSPISWDLDYHASRAAACRRSESNSSAGSSGAEIIASTGRQRSARAAPIERRMSCRFQRMS